MIKRAVTETESDAVEAIVQELLSAYVTLVTSDLAVIEVSRALRTRLDAEDPAEIAALIDQVFEGVHTAPIGDEVVSIARRLGPATLRSLDAIHLATATLLGADQVITYDHRMLQAAAELGFTTAQPR